MLRTAIRRLAYLYLYLYLYPMVYRCTADVEAVVESTEAAVHTTD